MLDFKVLGGSAQTQTSETLVVVPRLSDDDQNLGKARAELQVTSQYITIDEFTHLMRTIQKSKRRGRGSYLHSRMKTG